MISIGNEETRMNNCGRTLINLEVKADLVEFKFSIFFFFAENQYKIQLFKFLFLFVHIITDLPE